MAAIVRPFRFVALLAAALAFAPAAMASFHLFRIEQLFSNADGTIQFIVMHEISGSDDEDIWGGQMLTSSGTGGNKAFMFPTNLPNRSTAGKRVLIATASFAALGVIAPDYTIPDHFLSTGAGTLDYAGGTDSVTYSSLPTNGINAIARDGTQMANQATNFAGASVAVGPLPVTFGNATGMWWKPQESGWGINFAHEGDIIFATWFTYDAQRNPWWLIAELHKSAAGVYSGPVSTVTGPPFDSVPFPPGGSAGGAIETIVGTATVTFADGNNATFASTINGVGQPTKAITRQVFGPVPTCSVAGGAVVAAASGSDLPGYPLSQ